MSAFTTEAAAKHIGALLGVGVTAKKAAATDLKGPFALGLIDDEQKELCCVFQFDLASAGSMGAALSRIPAGAVQDSVKKGVLEPGLMENFHEIVNVLTVLSTAAIGRRTILRTTQQGKEAATPAVTEFINKSKNKVFVQMTIAGYPAGVFAYIM